MLRDRCRGIGVGAGRPSTEPSEGQMMSQPRFTVVIPTWNRSDMLARAIPSALSQTLEDIEVFVSDNGSTDDTAEVVRSFDDPRLRYEPLPDNIGMHGNWNRCLTFGTAPYIAFLHDDDLWYPANLERKAAFLDAHPTVGAVHSPIDRADADGTVYDRGVVFGGGSPVGVEPGHRFIRRQMHHAGLIEFSGTALRRSSVGDVRFEVEDGTAPADVGFRLRMALGSDLGFIDEVLSVQTKHRGSLTTSHILSEGADERTVVASIDSIRELSAMKQRFLREHADSLRDDPKLLHRLAKRGTRLQLAKALDYATRPDRPSGPTIALVREAAALDPAVLGEPRVLKVIASALTGEPARRTVRSLRA
jgi:hypothetical protein